MKKADLILPADIERETGLSIDLVRKWRSRYGFPVPVTEDKVTGYTREQAHRLKLIARLLNGGFKPSQVIGKSLPELERFAASLSANIADATNWDPFTTQAIELLRQHAIERLEEGLRAELARLGLVEFVRQTVAALATALGDAWARGDIETHQEHLCSSLLMRLLQAGIHSAKPKPSGKRVLLATPPAELHTLGILMVQAILSEAGVYSIVLGANTPVGEIPKAASKCGVAVVALSFSFAFPARKVLPVLEDLRAHLDPGIEIWIGGKGVKHLPKLAIPGVRTFSDLNMPIPELLAGPDVLA